MAKSESSWVVKVALLSTAALVGATAAAQIDPQDYLQLATVPAENTVDPNYKPPRTSWGHPNLEGVYSTDDMRSVPRERPEEIGTRATLTPEEFAERAKRDFEERDRVLNTQAWASRSVGSRTFGYSSQVIDPPNGRIPPFTEQALARSRGDRDRGTYGPGPFDAFEDFHLYDRCITRGILGSKFNVSYGNGLRISQSPEAVVIAYEMVGDARVVLLGDRPHPDDNVRTYLGNSRGYWDGDTLVVETKNLTDKTSIGGNGIGVPHSKEMVITERFTRVHDDMIEYTARVEDPVTYTQPFTIRMMLTGQPGYEIFEYSCHEGNRAVSGGLGGERLHERLVAEALAAGRPAPERSPTHPDGLDGALPEDDDGFINVNAGEN